MAVRSPGFINRELSWLEFNQRVLEEARDPGVPPLERLNFLAITASNLDEFFMVRVGGLQMLVAQGVQTPDPSGMAPGRQLAQVEARVRIMVGAQYACFRDELEPLLASAGIRRIEPSALTAAQRSHLERFFEEEVYSVVSPMAVSAGFPHLANRRLGMAVRMKAKAAGRRWEYGVIPIGPTLPRLVTVPSDAEYAYCLIEEVIRLFADRLFPGRELAEAIAFRITRNADISVREDQAADFLAEMENVLDQREEARCVRLEIEAAASRSLLSFLSQSLSLTDREVYEASGPLDLSAFRALVSMSRFESLRYPPWLPQPCPGVDPRRSIFKELSRRDVLLIHPYHSFEPVVRLVEEAAADPDVLAIKQILYRTSENSPFVAALAAAAERGKSVTALVELKARFDEAQNIEWARDLERAGVQVIYGVKGLKTHAKLCMAVRREPGGIVRYLHFGTGNYNEKTARLYSDVSYMTRDADLGADAAAFLNAIAGDSEPRPFLKVAAATMGLRERLLELIDGEAERRRQGQKALIRAKMNSLVCPKIIMALYKASQAGVRIDLNVRGICCLRPGVKGISENIRVVSIVDRFLEHSRIFCFHHGGAERVFISSADWMPRNLDRRVELMVPVDDAACRRELILALNTYFDDTAKSWRLTPDGTYRRLSRTKGKPVRSQEILWRRAVDAVKREAAARRTVFEPYRPGAGGES
jgi:polyphosphate kinase